VQKRKKNFEVEAFINVVGEYNNRNFQEKMVRETSNPAQLQ